MEEGKFSGEVSFLGTNPPEQQAPQEQTQQEEVSSLTETNEESVVSTTQEEAAQPEKPTQEELPKPEFNWQEEAKKAGWGTEETFKEKFEAEFNKPTTDNPLILKALELQEKGINVDRNTLIMASEDFSSYNTDDLNTSKELVKRKMKLDKPHLSSEEINYLVESDFGLATKQLDEDDVDFDTKLAAQKDSQMRLKISGKEAKKSLEDYAKTLEIPDGGTPQRSQEEILRQESEMKAAREKYVNMTTEAVEIYSGEEFKLNDSETFKWEAKPESKSEIHDLMQRGVDDVLQILPKTESGDVDLKEVARMLYIHKNFGSISKGLIDQATATARQDFINNELKNYTKTNTSTPNVQQTRTDGLNEKQAAFLKAFG